MGSLLERQVQGDPLSALAERWRKRLETPPATEPDPSLDDLDRIAARYGVAPRRRVPATPMDSTARNAFRESAGPTLSAPPDNTAVARSPLDAERTALSPSDEVAFRRWAAQAGVRDLDHPESRYDYRGYWRDVASKGGDQTKIYPDGPHFPDRYKQHGHPTFSVESKYSAGPADGGRWAGEVFQPAVAEARAAGVPPNPVVAGAVTGARQFLMDTGSGMQALASVAEMTPLRGGSPVLAEAGRRWEAAGKKIPEMRGRVERVRDIQAPRDFASWVAFQAAQGAVSSIPSLVGGVAARGATKGAQLLAGALPVYPQMVGNVRTDLMQDGRASARTRDVVAAVAGVPLAGLEAVMETRAARRAFGVGGRAPTSRAGAAVAGGIEGAGTEAVTEALQEGLQMGVTGAANRRPTTAGEVFERLTESAAAGAAGGGVVGAGVAAFGPRRAATAPPRAARETGPVQPPQPAEAAPRERDERGRLVPRVGDDVTAPVAVNGETMFLRGTVVEQNGQAFVETEDGVRPIPIATHGWVVTEDLRRESRERLDAGQREVEAAAVAAREAEAAAVAPPAPTAPENLEWKAYNDASLRSMRSAAKAALRPEETPAAAGYYADLRKQIAEIDAILASRGGKPPAPVPTPPAEAAAVAPPAPIVGPQGREATVTLEEVPPPRVAAPPRAPLPPISGPAGAAATVTLSDGSKLPARYRVVEADALQSSHHPFTFQKNPDYPEGVQSRAYDRDPSAQQVVKERAMKLDPDLSLDLSVSADKGPPIVTGEGLVIAGNERSMHPRIARELAPERYQAYRAALLERAEQLGLSRADVDAMRNPVLVREMTERGVAPERLAEINRLSDMPDTKSKSAMDEAMGRAAAMREATDALDHFSGTFAGDETLAEYLGRADGKTFVRKLVEHKVIGKQEMSRLADPNGVLTDDGKALVRRMMLAAAIGDSDALARAPASVLAKLEGAVPSLVVARNVPNWDLGRRIADALKEMTTARANGLTAEQLGQGSMFDSPASESVMRMIRFLDGRKKAEITEAFRRYAARARESVGQAESVDMFGAKPTTSAEAERDIIAASPIQSAAETKLVRHQKFAARARAKNRIGEAEYHDKLAKQAQAEIIKERSGAISAGEMRARRGELGFAENEAEGRAGQDQIDAFAELVGPETASSAEAAKPQPPPDPFKVSPRRAQRDVFEEDEIAGMPEFQQEGGERLERGRRRIASRTDDQGMLLGQTAKQLRAFWRWFGDSKVVNQAGQPRTVFHGTIADFDAFEQTADLGFHVGTLEQATHFVTPAPFAFEGTGENIMPLYARIVNPLRMPDLGGWNVRNVVANLKGKLTDAQHAELARRAFSPGPPPPGGYASDSEDISIRDALEEFGYDGIVYKNVHEGLSGKEHDSFIAFRANQLKSAVGNRGTFDPSDPSVVAAPFGNIGQRDMRGNLEVPADYEGQGPVGPHHVIKSFIDVATALDKVLRMRVGVGKMRSAAGFFNVRTQIVRLREANNIPTGAHELAHAVEKFIYGWPKGSPWKKPRIGRPIQKELVALGKALYVSTKPVAGYKREGFAEFVRMWLTGSDKLPGAAPLFHEWFETEFMAKDQKHAAAMHYARGLTKRYREQGSRKRMEGTVVFADRWEEKAKLYKERLKTVVSTAVHIEMLQPYRELQKEAVKSLGRPLTFKERPFDLADVLRMKHSAIAAGWVERGMTDLAGNIVGPPLSEITPLIKGRGLEFTLYVYARRAMALYTDPHGPRNPGVSKQDAQQVVTEMDEQYPQFALAASKVYAWNDGVLNYLGQSSEVYAEAVKQIRKRDPGDYVPLKREVEDLVDAYFGRSGGGSARAGSVGQRLKGSGRRVKEILPGLIAGAERRARLAHERMVVDAIVRLSKVEGLGWLLEEVPIPERPVMSRTVGEMIKEINDRLEGRVMASAEMTGPEASEAMDAVLRFYEPIRETPKGKPIIQVKVGEEMRWYYLDRQMYDLMEGLDVYRLPGAIHGVPVVDWMFGAPARISRAGTTGLRASFGLLWNPTRDLQTFWMNTQSNAHAGKLLIEWLRGIGSVLKYRATGKSGNPALHHFLAMGGEMAQPLGADIEHTRRVARQLAQGKAARYANLKHPVITFRNWLDLYRDIVQIPELAPRLAELKLIAEEEGIDLTGPITVEQAHRLQSAASKVTVDFAAAGSLWRVVNQIKPYANVSIQGPRAFARAAKRAPWKVAGRLWQLSMATLLLWWFNKDDEEYIAMDPRERFLNWHVKFERPDGSVQWIRLPRSQDAGFIAAMTEAFADAAYRVQNKGGAAFETVWDWLKATADASAPGIVPVLAEEIYEQARNRDSYFGTPIVPDWMRQGSTAIPPEEQVSEYTTKVSIELGRLFNASPMRVDHAIRGIGGGFATDVLGVLGLGGAGLARDPELADLPVVGRAFVRGGIPSRSKAVEDLYERRDQAIVRRNSRRRTETPAEAGERELLSDATQAVSAVLSVRRFVPDMLRRQELTKLATQIATDALAGQGSKADLSAAEKHFTDERKGREARLRTTGGR